MLRKTIPLAVVLSLVAPIARAEAPICFPGRDVLDLARVMWIEARGEPDIGQQWIGYVVMNRANSQQFPSSIREVLLDRKHACQFTRLCRRDLREIPFSTKELRNACIVYHLYHPEVEPTGGMMYFNTSRGTVRIGNHWFSK